MSAAKHNWKLSQRKMSEAQKHQKDSQKHQDKQTELGQFRYDKSVKGWRGPTSTVLRAVSKMKGESGADQNWDHLLSRLRNNREVQKQQMTKPPQQFVKKALVDAPNPDLDKEEEDDVASISEDPVREKPEVKHPFKVDYTRHPNWEKPRSDVNDISQKEHAFQFEKPEGGDSVCYTSSHQQVQRLTQDVAEREKIIGSLRQEMMKAHKEAAKLSSELSRYSGSDYEELKKENGMLRSTLSRMVRDNMRLHGQVHAHSNTVIIRQQMADDMDRKYGFHNRKSEPVGNSSSRGARCTGGSGASARLHAPDSPAGSEHSSSARSRGSRGPSAGRASGHPRALPRRQLSFQQQPVPLAVA